MRCFLDKIGGKSRILQIFQLRFFYGEGERKREERNDREEEEEDILGKEHQGVSEELKL